MTIDLSQVLPQALIAGVGLATMAFGGWAARTLYRVVQIVAILESKVEDHAELHAAHDKRAYEHESRISRVEGALPKGGSLR